MSLKKAYRKQSGRTYLIIAQKYRNPKTNTFTGHTVKSLDYLNELEKECDINAKKIVYEKQIVFWPKKYDKKAKVECEELVIKAHALVAEQKNTTIP